jgi:hypothetical protein
MSWYWKEINDKGSAEDATKAAVGISYFIAAVTGLIAVLSIVYAKPIIGLDGWSLVDAVLFVVIGWRISRLSRAWAVVGIALYLLEAIDSIGQRGVRVGVLTIVFTIAYVNALRGVFAYHKYAKLQAAEASESASAASTV